MRTLYWSQFRCLFPSAVTNDSSGNTLREDIRDAQGTLTKTVGYQYDVLGRMMRQTYPDNTYSEYTYDGLGNRTSLRDPKDNTHTYEYDALGRLTDVIQPGNIRTTYGHDAPRWLTSFTDGNGNTTTYQNDDMGRLYQESSPDTGLTTYQYDPAGNMISKADARGISINYQYDGLNRLSSIDFPTYQDIIYTYDVCPNGKGRLCRVVDEAGTTTYAYSPKGELVQEDRLILGVNYTTGYRYDGNGNLAVVTYPSGRTVTYVYDSADQTTAVLTTSPGGAQEVVASTIVHNPFGPVSSLAFGNGLIRSVSHDLLYRVVGVQTGAIQDLTYERDPNDNIEMITDNLNPTNNKTFSYDPLDRLEGATGPWGTISWAYDNVGNRETYTDGAGTTHYTYFTGTNLVNELFGPTAATYSYDNAGNTKTEGSREYYYNENGDLVRVTDGLSLGEYTYNSDSQRVVKTTGVDTTIFHYDQSELLVAETLPDGTVQAEYIYLAGQPLAKGGDGELHFIHNDHLGTPVLMTDSGGGTIWSLEDRPFGDDRNTTGNEDLNIGFPGQYFDQESALSYNHYRYYAPLIGRYTQPDPLGMRGDWHLYVYTKNNPLLYSDPRGLQTKPPNTEDRPGWGGAKPRGGWRRFRECWDKPNFNTSGFMAWLQGWLGYGTYWGGERTSPGAGGHASMVCPQAPGWKPTYWCDMDLPFKKNEGGKGYEIDWKELDPDMWYFRDWCDSQGKDYKGNCSNEIPFQGRAVLCVCCKWECDEGK